MFNRSYLDMQKWNPLINQVFYERHPKDPKQIRTYRMNWNGFANKITPMISNWHTAEPTEEMKPYHPKIMSAVLTQQTNHMGDFYG